MSDFDETAVHATHCCHRCGCKYGDEDCPVTCGKVQGIARHECENCEHDPDIDNEEAFATLTADLARVTAERDRLRTIVEMMAENASDVRVFLPDVMRKWFDPMTAKATEALKATT